MSETARPRTRDDRGFTLVEVIATVVIIGLVVGPLATGLVQALNLVPQSGRRTRLATDLTRLQLTTSNDIAQATQVVVYNPPNTSGVQSGASTAFNYPFVDTQDGASPTTASIAAKDTPCVTTATAAPANQPTVAHTLSFDDTSGAKKWYWHYYRLSFAAAGAAGVMAVEVHRWTQSLDWSGLGWSPLVDEGVYVAGYCKTSETDVVSVSATAPGASVTNERVTLVLRLHPDPAAAEPRGNATIEATVRAGTS